MRDAILLILAGMALQCGAAALFAWWLNQDSETDVMMDINSDAPGRGR